MGVKMSLTQLTPDVDDKRAMLTVIAMMEELRKVQPDLPISRVCTLLSVALEEGKSVNDYAEDTGIPPTTITRHLLDLGSMNRKRQAGLGLLLQRMDPNDLRRHQTFLTPMGRALVHRILRIFRHGR